MTNFKAGDKARFRADRKELYDDVFGSGDIERLRGIIAPAFDGVHEVLRVYPYEGPTEQTQQVLLVGLHEAAAMQTDAIGAGWFEEAV